MRGERAASIVVFLVLTCCSVGDRPGRSAPVDASPARPVDASTVAAPRPEASPGEDLAEQLRALGYLDWVELSPRDLSLKGVIRHDLARAWPGLNLYASFTKSEAYLMDMSGRVIHTWSSPHRGEGWQHAELAPEGDLYVVDKDRALVKLNWRSRVRWRKRGRFHHDLALDRRGRVYALERRPIRLEAGAESVRLMDDQVVVFSPRGDRLARYSLYDLLGRRLPEKRQREIEAMAAGAASRPAEDDEHINLFHANSIQVVAADFPGICRRGDLLVSLRNLNRIVIIDLEARRIRWSWGDEVLEEQHHPTLYADGRLLLFDNGVQRRFSRIVELDPIRRAITWEFRGSPQTTFFSQRRGAVERLPNNNLLITESAAGRVFEINRSGEVVWDFYNPEIDAAKRRRAVIYRMARFRPEFLRPGLLPARE